MKEIVVCCIFALVLAACATVRPGNPSYNWLNGVWNGRGDYWEQTFRFTVVDGNKVVGWQESRNDSLGQVGQGQLDGEIIGDTIRVTVYKQTTTQYTIHITPEGHLINHGIVLRKTG